MQGISLKSVSEIQFAGFFTKTLPPIIAFLLVIIIAKNLASLTWVILPQPATMPVPFEAAALLSENNGIAAGATSGLTNSPVAQIANWHLFGQVPNIPAPIAHQEPVVQQEAPDTTLRLTLTGVAASADMLDAWAIISDRTGNEDTYSIDDDLPDRAVLKEIYADRVILLHNGRRETLRLPQTDVSGAISNKARSNIRSSNTRRPNRSQRKPVRPSGSVNHLSFEASQVVKSYKQKLLNDPQSVMNAMRAEPYRQSGQLKGYRIFPGKDKLLFGQVGLEPGDVVTGVNGIELNSPLKGLEVMQNIQNASDVTVNVLRNGVNQTFVVPLN